MTNFNRQDWLNLTKYISGEYLGGWTVGGLDERDMTLSVGELVGQKASKMASTSSSFSSTSSITSSSSSCSKSGLLLPSQGLHPPPLPAGHWPPVTELHFRDLLEWDPLLLSPQISGWMNLIKCISFNLRVFRTDRPTHASLSEV